MLQCWVVGFPPALSFGISSTMLKSPPKMLLVLF